MSDVQLLDASALSAKMVAVAQTRCVWLKARKEHMAAQAALEEAETAYKCARNDATDELWRQVGIEKFQL